MRFNVFSFFIIFISLNACSPNSTKTEIKKGNWLFELQISEANPELRIPFNVKVVDSINFIISNAEEQIDVTEIAYKNDSVFITMPVFGSELRGKLRNNSIEGNYINFNKSEPFKMKFIARFDRTNRFEVTDKETLDFSGNWQADFISDTDSSPAIGIFKQKGSYITGTFQTETGDYRYLQGVVNGNTMQLSCFDGAHAFLFTAVQNKGQLEGMFYSGNTWKQKWVAEKTDNPELGDMKSFTFLNPGFEKLTFSFPNEKKERISLDNEKYQNKVVIVQIFGTWCPNCMDETSYLVELHKKYNSKGLEIIGLDFEPNTDFDYFKKRIQRFRNDLNVPYELVLAGPSNKQKAAESLPMLNKVISYPTAIFIDKKGNVREIHTGFSGPGTGKDYEDYKKETEELIQELLSD